MFIVAVPLVKHRRGPGSHISPDAADTRAWRPEARWIFSAMAMLSAAKWKFTPVVAGARWLARRR